MQPATDDLVDALARTAFDVMQVITRVATAHDLSLTQVRAMGILRDHEPRLSELAEHLGLDKSSISGLIDRAERRGLLERYPDEADGRASRVRLTASGRALAERAQGEVREGMSPFVAHLTPGERSALIAALTRTRSTVA